MALFKRGYEAARDEKKRQDEYKEKMQNRLFRFFLSGDGAEARVRFLTEEPVTFSEHTVKVFRGGKERFDNFVCSGDADCPYCEEDDRPSFKGAFLIWDYTPFEYTDSNGKKKKSNGSLKLYVAGTRVLSQLDRLSSKYGLTDRDYEISRTGSGTSTTYLIERTDDVEPLTKGKITNMLPEKLREKFDGTVDSLMSIVEDQLKMYLPSADTSPNGDNDDDEDEYDTTYTKSGKNLVDLDDEDDDDEDDKPVKRKSLPGVKKSKPSIKGTFKKK